MGLTIPEGDKLRMKLDSRRRVSRSWPEAVRIAEHIRSMDGLGDYRRAQYSTAILLASAAGLRCSELLALKIDDIDFVASTIRVEESSDQRGAGKVGLCKNPTAYRTVLLRDPEGIEAMRELKRFVGTATDPTALVFHSKRGNPLMETTILHQGLHPALKSLGFQRSGLHAFRRGCNRRWELAGINPAVIRQQMGHTTAAMTMLYSGEIPNADVAAEFSKKFGTKIVVLENMENKTAA
jgi:integrase